MKKTLIVCIIFLAMLLSVSKITGYCQEAISYANSSFVIDAKLENKSIKIQCYDDNTYLKNVGTNRGDYQIREVIPYLLKKGETITLKQKKGYGSVDLTLELKTGLAVNDVSAKISKDGSESTLVALEESVVYIKLPRESFEEIELEYSISKATTLPIFIQGETKEKDFFELWDSINSQNAVIENDVIIMQIPKVNKELLRDLKGLSDFNDIEHLLNYYDDMIKFYDNAYGLDGTEVYNYNPRQRYLIVPELKYNNGVIGTYSTDIVRGYNESYGVKKFLDDSWLAKHELAHGYQGSFMDDDVSVREIWNNILAHYYSMVTESNYTRYRENYLTEKVSNQTEVYEKSQNIQNGTEGAQYKLEFWLEIFDTFGLDIFSEFNQEYRRLGVTGEHDDTTNTNIFSEYMSKAAGINFVPYFLSFGGTVSDEVIQDVIELPNVAYLCDLVNKEESINTIIHDYNLASKYSLVDSSIFYKDSKLTKIVGNANISITIDDLTNLEGKQIVLKNGDLEYKIKIDAKNLKISGIPAGIYNLLVPVAKEESYHIVHDTYVTISENTDANIKISYNQMKDNYLNMAYRFYIKTNKNYTPLVANISYVQDGVYNLEVNSMAGKVNSNIEGTGVYAYIEVYDDKGVKIHRTEFYNNTESVDGQWNVELKENYEILLFRDEMMDRKYYENILTGDKFYDNEVELMRFKVTSDGLEYKDETLKEDNFRTVLDSFLQIMSTSSQNTKSQYFNVDVIEILKNALKHSGDDKLIKEYQELAKNGNPVIEITGEENTLNLSKTSLELWVSSHVTAMDVEDGDLRQKLTILNQRELQLYSGSIITLQLYVEDSDYNFNTIEWTLRVVGQTEVTDPIEIIEEQIKSHNSNFEHRLESNVFFTNSEGEAEILEVCLSNAIIFNSSYSMVNCNNKSIQVFLIHNNREIVPVNSVTCSTEMVDLIQIGNRLQVIYKIKIDLEKLRIGRIEINANLMFDILD